MDAKPMSQTERNELRRIIRGDFATLRAELDQRGAEMTAGVEHRVAQRFEPSNAAARESQRKIEAAVSQANDAIAAAIDEAVATADGYHAEWVPLSAPRVMWQATKREEMRRALRADIEAKVGAARVTLQRQEVELLKRLSVEALTSETSRAFLASIPTVAELVPESRLAELEAAFDDSGDLS